MRLLRNQRGDAFVFSLILLAISGIVFLSTQVVQEASQRRLNQYKLRSQMNIIEQGVRAALMQPQAYIGCQTGSAGSQGCSLNTAFLKVFENTPVIGVPCAEKVKGSLPCSFKARDWSLNPSSLEAKVTLELVGSDLIQKSLITVQIPEELLQSQVFSCPQIDPSKPILMGLEPGTGKVKCRGIAACGVGSYMTGVSADQTETYCSKIPTNTVSCGSDQFISQFSWQGSKFQSSCSDRLDPFSYFGGP